MGEGTGHPRPGREPRPWRSPTVGQTTFSLRPVPPFRLDLTVWALRRRPANAVDRWDGTTYSRVLVVDGRAVDVRVSQDGPPEDPFVRVEARARGRTVEREVIEATLSRMLGLHLPLDAFYARARGDRHLGPLAAGFRGLKPPRFPTVFECLINAFACQQVTLALGIVLLNRLAERYGRRTERTSAPAFPGPADLAGGRIEDLREMGFSRHKARAILELAREGAEGRLDLEALEAVGDEEALGRLLGIRGVGRWTAEYVLLRGLGRLHVFPGDDVGARRNLQRWLGLRHPLDYGAVRRALARWAPYAGLVYFHLLLDHLERSGALQGAPAAGTGMSR